MEMDDEEFLHWWYRRFTSLSASPVASNTHGRLLAGWNVEYAQEKVSTLTQLHMHPRPSLHNQNQ